MAPQRPDLRPEGRWTITVVDENVTRLVWEPPVPRVPDEILESIFYLYPSQQAAEDAEQAGGCGFFLNYPFEHENRNHLYAVTNRHVISSGNWTFRVNN